LGKSASGIWIDLAPGIQKKVTMAAQVRTEQFLADLGFQLARGQVPGEMQHATEGIGGSQSEQVPDEKNLFLRWGRQE
jgi:hypothetical protein